MKFDSGTTEHKRLIDLTHVISFEENFVLLWPPMAGTLQLGLL